jgi:pimeloyl-ACP methyl ester carboxylesterase
VVQNPTLSLPGDAAATRLIIDAQDGPVVLVGHSYGGAVISEAGTHPNVAALVYVCAFAPDKDESVNSLIGGSPADGPQPQPGAPCPGGPGRTSWRWRAATPSTSPSRPQSRTSSSRPPPP